MDYTVSHLCLFSKGNLLRNLHLDEGMSQYISFIKQVTLLHQATILMWWGREIYMPSSPEQLCQQGHNTLR
jgi:hypothetical protein